MAKLAHLKRGKLVTSPERAPDLAAFDATPTESPGIERSAPFGNPLGALLLLLVACLAWMLRRRWGEV